MLQTWWLSFCDPTLPTGSQFLGVAIVEAKDFIAAVSTAHLLGINPKGSEVKGTQIPEDANIPQAARNQLLSKAELEKLWGDLVVWK